MHLEPGTRYLVAMDERLDVETRLLTAMVSTEFALYVRGQATEAALHAAAGDLVRHLVERGVAPEGAIRCVKQSIPWAELIALPVDEVPGHDPTRARDALIRWTISAYFRERELAKQEGRLRER